MAINDWQTLNYFLQWARGDIVEYILSLCFTGARLDDFGLDEPSVAYYIKEIFVLFD